MIVDVISGKATITLAICQFIQQLKPPFSKTWIPNFTKGTIYQSHPPHLLVNGGSIYHLLS